MNKVLIKFLMSLTLLCGVAFSMGAQDNMSAPKKNEVSIGKTKLSRDGKELVVDYQMVLRYYRLLYQKTLHLHLYLYLLLSFLF